MTNLQLHMKCRAILTYSNVVVIFLNRLEVTYERACMATPKEKYHMNMLETLVDYNDRNNVPFSNENLRQAVSKVMAET